MTASFDKLRMTKMEANNSSTLMGTAGGTFLSIVPNINSEDIAKTIILASVGAMSALRFRYYLKAYKRSTKNKFSPCCGDLWVKL